MHKHQRDVHTYARPDEAVVTELDLDLQVDFDAKTLTGKASFKIDNKTGTTSLFLDTYKLNIERVTLDNQERDTKYDLGKHQPWIGSPLHITIEPNTRYVHVYYSTSPEAPAVQWLEAHQTAGGRMPFLFTQSQAILARTWVPCQDSPGIRFSYTASVEVPKGMMALMSAENPQEISEDGHYYFEMEQPIPSYLLALAVGDFKFKALTENTGVYAEPETLEAAAYEFADMDKMLTTAEDLYGPYRWDRYDVLVLPPSFPFGGMENPRLTFATPTILAGDRSLVSLVAHELAHSWSGNLVTNATWNDFWLNEGFTVYFERRIMEELEGADYADMLEILGYQDLMRTAQELGENSDATKLKLDLAGKDADDGMNQIAYEKGYFMLRRIEDHVGRERFDAWLRQYFNTFAFRSMNTEEWLTYVNQTLLQGDENLRAELNLEEWIYEPGIPANIKVKQSTRFAQVNDALDAFNTGTAPSKLNTANWSTHEWLHFIRHLGADLTIEHIGDLDKAFGFTESKNAEILAAWFEHTIRHNYHEADAALENFLLHVGRRKFILPLYRALKETPEGKKRALDIYSRARPTYHPVAYNTLDEVLGWHAEAGVA